MAAARFVLSTFIVSCLCTVHNSGVLEPLSSSTRAMTLKHNSTSSFQKEGPCDGVPGNCQHVYDMVTRMMYSAIVNKVAQGKRAHWSHWILGIDSKRRADTQMACVDTSTTISSMVCDCQRNADTVFMLLTGSKDDNQDNVVGMSTLDSEDTSKFMASLEVNQNTAYLFHDTMGKGMHHFVLEKIEGESEPQFRLYMAFASGFRVRDYMENFYHIIDYKKKDRYHSTLTQWTGTLSLEKTKSFFTALITTMSDLTANLNSDTMKAYDDFWGRYQPSKTESELFKRFTGTAKLLVASWRPIVEDVNFQKELMYKETGCAATNECAWGESEGPQILGGNHQVVSEEEAYVKKLIALKAKEAKEAAKQAKEAAKQAKKSKGKKGK
eukprot:jgi/Bigna1/86988/estExt_fgenesh1_pg.C_150238